MDGGRGRVVVVAGGGNGIGAQAAVELARRGATVVVVDPGVDVRGFPAGEESAAETVRRVQADGGTAVASTVSVTDADALRELFAEVVTRYGSLDAVVNTAGITRHAAAHEVAEDDWVATFDVHVEGYLNVLRAALPLMADAGHGRVVGVTSGVGLARTSPDAVAYGTAKRAVAALTREIGRVAPDGVVVNALSPIAATRMVRETLARGASPQGLDMSGLPHPSAMAPAAALMADASFDWCSGRIIFSAGSELSLVAHPRLLEAVAADGDFAAALATVVPTVLVPAAAAQRTNGGADPRFGPITSAAPAFSGPPDRRCVVVADDPAAVSAVSGALACWGVAAVPVDARAADFEAAAQAVTAAGRVDAVVVMLRDVPSTAAGGPPWQQVLDSHRDTSRRIRAHAAWLRAASRHARADGDRPQRIVHVAHAVTPGGRTAAQAVAQLVRTAQDTPSMPTDVFGVAAEDVSLADLPLADLVARLVAAEDTRPLAGAELVARPGWVGVRSHPGPIATAAFGGPAIPGWVPDMLREAITG